MRVPLSWIREFTPVDAAPADIADALNQLGLEVEEIIEPGRDINGVVVAWIVDVVPHPDADRIRLADVEYGDGQFRVVCGASNIEPGMVVPFARVGAVLPGDFTIERRKIRGVVSEGMLCSPRELGLGDDHGGILSLPADAPLGTDVREVLGLDDVVFDLSITPNRPDAMGVVGVARELAAHFNAPFHVDERAPAPLVEDARRRAGRRRGHRSVSAIRRARCSRRDGCISGVDATPAGARRNATDQQRRRRHELRDARAVPAVARLRPRKARGSGDRRAPRGRRRDDDHARRRRTGPHARRPVDL